MWVMQRLVCWIFSPFPFPFVWPTQDIPKPKQPQFILNVETEELGIQAGLQDRVIQVLPLYCSCIVKTIITLSDWSFQKFSIKLTLKKIYPEIIIIILLLINRYMKVWCTWTFLRSWWINRDMVSSCSCMCVWVSEWVRLLIVFMGIIMFPW